MCLATIADNLDSEFAYALMDKYKIIIMFNIDRFNFLLPMLWVLLLASALATLNMQKSWQRSTAVALSLLVILCIGAFDKELKYNAKLLLELKSEEPTFRRSYAPELFAEIKKPTGKLQGCNGGCIADNCLFQRLNILRHDYYGAHFA